MEDDDPNNRFLDDVAMSDEDDITSDDADDTTSDGNDDYGEDDEDDDEDDGFDLFLYFCHAIQMNDARVRQVNTRGLEGYGIPLGNALVGNTTVETLKLVLYPESIHGNANDNDIWLDRIAPLLQYVRDGPALKILNISAGILAYTAPFVRAAAQNPSITLLVLEENAAVPLADVANLLRNTHTLEGLVLRLVDSVEVAEALGANESLEKIKFLFVPDELPRPTGTCLLHGLSSHRRLHHLDIHQKPASTILTVNVFDAAFSAYLKATQCLKSLTLNDNVFNEDRMRHLLVGLASNQSVTILILARCQFDEGALRVVESLVGSNNTTAATDAASNISIRGLFVEGTDGPADQEVLAKLVTGSGRHLQVFNWSKCSEDTVVFWNTFSSRATNSGLRKLNLELLPRRHDTFSAAMAGLCKMPYLQDIGLKQKGDLLTNPDKARLFFQVVRQCGSLLGVTMCDKCITHYCSAAQSRYAKAMFMRNWLLPELLAHSSPALFQPQNDTVSLCPDLLQSAVLAPRQAPALLLTSLFTIDEDVVPAAKRGSLRMMRDQRP